MQPFLDDPDFTLYVGDALTVLSELPDESVHCVVTSPPYFGLRDYGTGTWDGGDPEHEHGAATASCSCGAVRVDHQVGLEATPFDFVDRMVVIFREVRRVLRSDGVCWLNLGDSYVGALSQHREGSAGKTSVISKKTLSGIPSTGRVERGIAQREAGLKPKDLMGIPWRVALALQEPYYTGRIKREADRAWLAALVDGEGTIGIRRHDSHSNVDGSPRCQDGFIPYLTIGNSDRELLDRCVALTGYGSVTVKSEPGTDERGINTRRTNYGWRLDANKAVEIIREIYPHLIVKRAQAILAYALDASNKNGRALRGNGPLPASEQRKREQLKALVNAANQREPVAIPSWCEAPASLWEPGWWLRSDCIWSKPSTMPESVTDRPTRSHEYLFLLTKSGRYFYDQEPIREAPSTVPQRRLTATADQPKGAGRSAAGIANPAVQGGPGLSVVPPQAETLTGEPPSPPKPKVISVVEKQGGTKFAEDGKPVGAKREYTEIKGANKRTVWEVSIQPFKDAHFAVFPEKLIEPCVLAGTSEHGCCPECGAPWERVTEGGEGTYEDRKALGFGGAQNMKYGEHPGNHRAARPSHIELTPAAKTTVGWEPTCECGNASSPPTPVPCVVLDPFMGSGTTALVSRRLGRKSIGIELNPTYAAMAAKRLSQQSLFA